MNLFEDPKTEVHEVAILKKFDGDVPPGTEDPEAAGFKLTEEITMVDGVITERKVFP